MYYVLCVCVLQITSAEIFLIGAVAKAIATTATYPLQTVQAILRVKQNGIKNIQYLNKMEHL